MTDLSVSRPSATLSTDIQNQESDNPNANGQLTADGNNPSAASTATTVVENAAELSFGPEFGDDIQILSNAQVAVYLQVSARSAVSRDEELNDVYRKTQKYVDRFNTMTNDEKEHQELVDELDNLQE